MSWLKKLVTTAVAILVIAVAGFWFYLSQHYVVPILMYHSVNPVSNPAIKNLIVSPQTFERQMRFLRSQNYNIITLDNLATLLRDKKKIPHKTVIITFDDGYEDNYTYAFSVLKKYGIPATVFIIIDEVARPITEDLKAGDARLSWRQIREMQDSGLISFGSHCFGPEPLVDIKSEKELKRQIRDSRFALEDKLGRRVELFSYPGGLFNGKIKNMVKDAGYRAAVGTSPGRQYPSDDLFLLKRIRISENARNLFVFWFESSGYYTFFKERRRK